MEASLHSYMKVGIVNFMAFPATGKGEGPIIESIEAIAHDTFFGGIELTTMKDAKVRAEAAKLLATSGLAVGYGAQPVELGNKWDLNSLDPAKRRAAVDGVKACVDEAIELGATKLGLLSGPYPGDENAARAMGLLTESLTELCEHSQRQGGPAIVMEVFDRTIDKKALVGPTSSGVEVAQALRKQHPSFGLMIDLSHLPLQFETAAESLGAAKDYLVHAHIGNCVVKEPSHPAYGDLHPRFGVAGGENSVPEVREFLSVLMEIGYIGAGKQNVVAFEVKPMGDETPQAVIANAKRTLAEAWALL
jgi:sugar phosphate isomerase/epimerase